MNNKGSVKISTYIIALIVLGMAFTGLLTMLSEANENEVSFLSGNETSDYQNLETRFGGFLDDVGNSTDSMRINSMQNSSQQAGAFGFLDMLINSGYSTFKTLYTTFGFATDSLLYIDTWGLGIPVWVGSGLIAIIVIIIMFGIWRFIFKVEG